MWWLIPAFLAFLVGWFLHKRYYPRLVNEDTFTDDHVATPESSSPPTVIERVKEFVERVVHPESTIKLLATGGDISTLSKALVELFYKNRKIEGLINTVVSEYNITVRTNPQLSSNSLKKREPKVVPLLKILNKDKVIYLSFPTMCDFNAMSMYNLVFTVSKCDKELLVITKSKDSITFTGADGKSFGTLALAEQCGKINTLRNLLDFVKAAVPHVKVSEPSPVSDEECDTPKRAEKIDSLIEALTKAVGERHGHSESRD